MSDELTGGGEESSAEDLNFWPVWEFDAGRQSGLARYVSTRAVPVDADLVARLDPDEERDPQQADLIRARRLYERLRAKGVDYGLEPWSATERVQQIRHPWWLFSDEHGTCIDIATVYAAMCLRDHVGVLLAVTAKHAFVVFEPGRLGRQGPLVDSAAAWREGAAVHGRAEQVEPGVLKLSLGTLRAALQGGSLVAVDAVKAARGGTDFEGARAAIDSWSEEASEEDVWLIDVPYLQRNGLEPLPEPPRSRPSIRMWVPSPGGRFDDYPAHREVIEKLEGRDGTVALIGASGRGKSTIALRQVERAPFGAAWYLDGSDRGALLNSLAKAMQVEMGQEEEDLPEAERKALGETGLARLKDVDGPWLVVIDNADGEPGDIRDLLPIPKPGQTLLITSTNPQWASYVDRAYELPPVGTGDMPRFGGGGIGGLIAGRPLLLNAFAKLDPEVDWGAAELPQPPPGTTEELRGPAVFWSLLRVRPQLGEAELRVVALAAFMPARSQPIGALAEIVDGGREAVARLALRGLFEVDRSQDSITLHRLFGHAVRDELEESEPALAEWAVKSLAGAPAARAALDDHGDLATVQRLDQRLAAIDERTPEPELRLGQALHGIGMLLELHGHTSESALTFERAERHVADQADLRADCLLGRARAVNQRPPKDDPALIYEAIAWSQDARRLKLDAGKEGSAYRALAMEGLLMQKAARFVEAGRPRDEALDEAERVLEEADRRRQALPDAEVPPAEKARSIYNLAGVRVSKAKASPVRASEHLERAEQIYAEVAERRGKIYKRMVHPHIAACVNGLGIVAYYRAMLLPVGDAEHAELLRRATGHAVEALRQRSILAGPVDDEHAAKTAGLLAKIALVRTTLPEGASGEDMVDQEDEANEELAGRERKPPPIRPLPSGRGGLVDAIEDWARSEALREVITAFGDEVPEELALPELLAWLDDFSDRWDTRTGERNVGDVADLPLDIREVVESSASALGLSGGGVEPRGEYDVVLILGGLARAGMSRPRYTAERLQGKEFGAARIVAIGGMRPLNEKETTLLAEMEESPAADEFEAMDGGIRKAFGLGVPSSEEGERVENPNASWWVRRYAIRTRAEVGGEPEPDTPVDVVAAPSSEPDKRRANTADTLAWLADNQVDFSALRRVLVVTTDIYVPFQHADAIRMLGLPYDVEIEVAGVIPGLIDGRLAHGFRLHQYLQEIRSTIRAYRALERTLAETS